MNFKEAALKIQDQLVSYRRDFHMEPELSFQEFKTQKKIKDFLNANGIEILPIESHTSVVAVVRGAKKGKTFAMRGDIDALPMQENRDVPYKSKIDGMMHSCGHDAHTALMMGAALLLNNVKDELAGDVRIIFQAAEELPPGGAKDLVAKGVMEGVDGVMAFHVSTAVPAGKVLYKYGAIGASADNFKITVTGLGGHGAHPQNCIDPVVISAQVINALQTIVSRNLAGPQAGVITIGSIHGGTKSNIIADDVVMEGTIRTLDKKVRELIPRRMEEVLKGIETSYNCKIKLELVYGYPVHVNNNEFIDSFAIPSSAKIAGEENIVMGTDPSMGAEDFSYFTELVPGCMGSLGSGNKEKGITANGHNAFFDIDEDCLSIGVACLVQTAWDFLNA